MDDTLAVLGSSAEGASDWDARVQTLLDDNDDAALKHLWSVLDRRFRKVRKAEKRRKKLERKERKERKHVDDYFFETCSSPPPPLWSAWMDVEHDAVAKEPPQPGVGLVYEAPPPTFLSDAVAYVTLFLVFGGVLLAPLLILLWVYLIYQGSMTAIAVLLVLLSSPMWAFSVSESVQKSRMLHSWRTFFRLRIWKEELMPTDQRNILMAVFPHGFFPMTLALSCGVTNEAFPEWGDTATTRMAGAVASVFFKMPVLSPVLTWLGCYPASPEYVRSLIRRGSCILLPDGIAGIFHSNRKREVVYVKARKGFIKMAIQEGATLVPTYCFGHTQLHDVSHGPGSVVMALSRRLRISLLLFAGQWGLPIPHRFPLVMCVGSPMPVTKIANPTQQEIDEVHAQFVQRLVELFNKRKHLVGWEDRELHVV